MVKTNENAGATAEAILDIPTAERFLFREARLLDERRFEEWIELFTEDGYYWVPSKPGQDNPDEEVSLFYDDLDFMRTRIQRLRHPRIHAQEPPSRTSHMIGNVQIESPPPPPGTDFLVSSQLVMFEYRPGSEQEVFTGRCYHALRLHNNQLKLAWKKVELINCDGMFRPILVPF